MTVCSVFGQPLARGVRRSDGDCPQHGLPERSEGRNYDVGSTLIRYEADREVYCLLTVETVRESRYGFPTIIYVRHEDGHREILQVKPGIPIERALFGYSVTSS